METKQLQNFIGQGIVLPLKLVDGKPPLESGFELIRASIINILSWKYGTRFFLGEYGSKLHLLLEEPNDQILQNTINIFVVEAINRWEHRIRMVNAQTERTYDTINLTVTYQILSTKEDDTFTFPFYKKISH